nr:JmjC domain-containing protein [Tanacetum cinerariifolium]
MLTVIDGRRWIIEHGLRLAVMKCAESIELRQVFADVVSVEIAKGMSKGLKHGVEHEKAKVDLVAIEAYDAEDLKYPLVDQLEKLKDAPINVIMASLFLESDSGEDAPQWIRELRPNSSQLKISVYPEVRSPKDPWSFKDEILLEDAIAANVSHIEKKKKCQVVCRTHRVSSAHHARSDGVPKSVPTVAPQGLAILLADIPNDNMMVAKHEDVENQKKKRKIKDKEEENMIVEKHEGAAKKKIRRSVVVKDEEEEDGFESRRWSSRSKARRPNYADDPFKHIFFDLKINPTKKPKKNPPSKKDTPTTTTTNAKKDTTRMRCAARHKVADENGNLVYVESVMCHQCQRNDKGAVVRCTK